MKDTAQNERHSLPQRKIRGAAGRRKGRFWEKSTEGRGRAKCRFIGKFAFLRARQSAILGEIRCALAAAQGVFFKNTARSRKTLPFGKKICAARQLKSFRDLEKTHRVFS